MPIFVFLHVLTIFAAVALAYGPAALIILASRRRDVGALRGIVNTYDRLGAAVRPTFGLGIVFGFAAVFFHGFDPLLGWLVIAYVLVIASLLTTFTFTNPWIKKVDAAAAASPDNQMSPELESLLNAPGNQLLLTFDALIIVLLIADMVLKPIPVRLF